MYILELAQHILHDMRVRKLRSFLALFGIMWGTVSVILLLALGQGFYQANRQSMMSLTSGAIIGSPGMTSKPYKGIPQGRTIHLKADDITSLPIVIPNIAAVSPRLGFRGKPQIITYQDKKATAPVRGVASSYPRLVKLNIELGGHFFMSIDVKKQQRVVVIGSKLKEQFFPHSSAIGKTILIQGIPFHVVGALSKTSLNSWRSRKTYIPYTTFISLFGDQDISRFLILPKNIAKVQQLKQEIYNFFANKFHFNPNDKQAIRIYDTGKMMEFFTWFFRSIQLFLGFCGALTLAVGGISVANMMFLIVTERTNEIGLRMALGARDYHIMLQIMLEAGIIVLIGALLGFLFSWVGITILHFLTLPSWIGKPEISSLSVFATVGILSLVALTAGYFPARRAAKLEPVVALAF